METKKALNIGIAAAAYYVPPLTKSIAEILEAEGIESSSRAGIDTLGAHLGIEQVHVCDEESPSDLALTAARLAIESIDVTRDASTSRIVKANLELREILVSVTEQVDAPEPSKTRAAPARNKKAKQGKKNKEKSSEANKAKVRESSVAIKGLKGLGIL